MITQKIPGLLVRIAFFAGVLSGPALVAQTAFSYSDNFSSYTSGTNLSTTSGSGTGYWYESAIDSTFTTASGVAPAYFNAAGSGTGHSLRLSWNSSNTSNKVLPNGTAGGSSAFALQNFTDSGLLSSGSYLINPSVTVSTGWAFGGSTDPKLWNYVGLLDSSGNGYLAGIGRNGSIVIWQVDGGLGNNASTWTELRSGTVQSTSAPTTGSVWTSLSFSLSGDTLMFTSSRSGGTSDSLSVTLSSLTYSDLTTIALGAGMAGNERADYQSLSVAATTSAIPEPSTIALLIGGFTLAAALVARRRSRAVN